MKKEEPVSKTLDDKGKLLNILVIDDEQDICDLVVGFLSQSAYVHKVLSANNPVQARQKMLNQAFDFLVVDFSLPGKTGIDLIKDIRKNPRFSKFEALLISGCLQQDNVLIAIKSKIKNILVKPFGQSQILKMMYQIFKLDGASDLVNATEAFKEADLSTEMDFDVDLDLDLDLDF